VNGNLRSLAVAAKEFDQPNLDRFTRGSFQHVSGNLVGPCLEVCAASFDLPDESPLAIRKQVLDGWTLQRLGEAIATKAGLLSGGLN